MRRRRYSEEYRNYGPAYSPDISPLEQIARTALELHKLLGVDNLDDRYFDSSAYETTENGYDKFYSLCVSKIPHRLSESDIRDAIYHECKYCGDFNVKISSYNGERVAYINFRSSRQAAKANDGLKNFKMDSKLVRIEPLINNKSKARSRSPPSSYNYDNYSHNNNNNNNNNRHGNESYSPVRYNRYNRSRSASRVSTKTNNKDCKSNYSNKDFASIPTRTLFIGNLPLDITETGLKDIFMKFGDVTDIDIKKPVTNRQTSSYAFIKFENLDIANRAKTEMSGHTIGKCQIKIGFGKVNPTSCVWVGGLGPWILYDTFEKEMSRFGAVKQIQWPHNKDYAYVLYESVDVAISAINKLRGTHFVDENKPIRVDFADISVMKQQHKEPDHKHQQRNPLKREAVMKASPNNKSTSSSVTDELSVYSAKNITQLISCLVDVWTGMIVLKNNNFGCRLYILKGEKSIISDFMLSKQKSDDNKGRVENLTITQRMKLDGQKLSEMSQRIELAGDNGFCLMLASSYIIDTKLVSDASKQPQRPLKNLITYLRTKESAGVIFLKSTAKNSSSNSNNQSSSISSSSSSSTAVLHAFPPCDFSFDILLQKAPNLTKDFLKDDFLVVLLIRNSV